MTPDWHKAFKQAESQLDTSLPRADAIVPQVPVEEQVVKDPPKLREEWETEIDEFARKNDGEFEIPLKRGSAIRVSKNPVNRPEQMVVTLEEFKRLARIAVTFNGKIVHAMSREQADSKEVRRKDEDAGFWFTPNMYIEMDKDKLAGMSRSTDMAFGVVAAPGNPTEYPAIDGNQWRELKFQDVIKETPMRVGDKVLGTLVKTARGAIYTKKVQRGDDRPMGINEKWAIGGAFSVDREMFGKYLVPENAVIRFVRENMDQTIYLTTVEHIKKYGGIVKNWGRERVIMPVAGKFWLQVRPHGE